MSYKDYDDDEYDFDIEDAYSAKTKPQVKPKAQPKQKKQVPKQQQQQELSESSTVNPPLKLISSASTQHLFDLVAKYEQREADQFDDSLNVCILGSVDSGKSTLMGHLLVDQQKDEYRSEFSHASQEAKQLGKPSFNYAYLLDRSQQERERGVTVSVGTIHAVLQSQNFILQDCPGHRDYVDSIFQQVIAPDAGIILADPTNYQKMISQFAENAQILMVFGVKHFIIVVNKMDLLKFEKSQFEEIVKVLKKQLKLQQISAKLGFKIQFIPCAGQQSEDSNISEYSKQMPYAESTLLLALGGVKKRQADASGQVNLLVIDVQVLDNSTIMCRVYVQSGTVSEADVLCSLPSQVALSVFLVFNLENKEINRAAAGGQYYLKLKSYDKQVNGLQVKLDSDGMTKWLKCGHSLQLAGAFIKQKQVMKYFKQFKAQLLLLNPLTQGDQLEVYVGLQKVNGQLMKIEAVMDKEKNQFLYTDQCVGSVGELVVCNIVLEELVIGEKFIDGGVFARIIVKAGNDVLGIGLVVALRPM